MAENMWDARYAAEDYVYGVRPNVFLRENAALLPVGDTLSLGEGEGRNAVFLAGLGHRVTAVDGSTVGLAKARKLAAAHNVAIETVCAELAGYTPTPGKYDAVMLIFLHLPPQIRSQIHQKALDALKPGGVVLLNAFHREQISLQSGGPRDPDMLYDADLLRRDFAACADIDVKSYRAELSEGPFHKGPAALLSMLARK